MRHSSDHFSDRTRIVYSDAISAANGLRRRGQRRGFFNPFSKRNEIGLCRQLELGQCIHLWG
jgi:hypothetical protein